MRSKISEFSYGYAVTEELMTINRWLSPGHIVAPAFPSLYREGQEGGGYDVEINAAGVPLFIQFKMSQVMLTRRATEIRRHQLFQTTPFYRMTLWPRSKSRQHDLLLHLEKQGNSVFYIAPAFHDTDDFNSYYAQSEVIENSIVIRPSEIGPIADNNEHSVSFQMPGNCYLCSDPRLIRRIDDELEYKRMIKSLLIDTAGRQTTPEALANYLVDFVNTESFVEILNKPIETSVNAIEEDADRPMPFEDFLPLVMPEVAEESVDVAQSYIDTLKTAYSREPLYKKAQFVSRCILGCEVFLLKRTQQ